MSIYVYCSGVIEWSRKSNFVVRRFLSKDHLDFDELADARLAVMQLFFDVSMQEVGNFEPSSALHQVAS